MKNLKSNQLSSFSLSEMEMGQVKGGQMTKENCASALNGGLFSSGNVNNKVGLNSPATPLFPSTKLNARGTSSYTFIWG